MTLLYYNPLFLEHRTGTHPERAERLVQVMRHLERTGLDQKCQRPDWQPATNDQLAQVHDPSYLARVEEFCRSGGGRIEVDTVCSERSAEVARLAAGAACDAVERVIKGEDRRALCLIRPPGHHALTDEAMGFCLFNNVVVAARHATRTLGLDRVLIADFDVHHGNATQDSTWSDERIGFLSIHRWPFYPGTGRAEETGTGAALGTKLNLPIEWGTTREAYLAAFRSGLERLAVKIRPDLVLVSAGFDAHRDDPVGSLGLETEDFAALTEAVVEVANTHAGGKIVSLLEGGYNTSILAGCVAEHLEGLQD